MQITIITHGKRRGTTLIRHTLEPRSNEVVVADRTNPSMRAGYAPMRIVRLSPHPMKEA